MAEIVVESRQGLMDKIQQLLLELQRGTVVEKTEDWYLQNNLAQFLESVRIATDSQDIENAARAFSRFCVDSMEWGTQRYRACANLTQLGLRVAKGQ